MAITKRNANLREENQRKAIESHYGFVTYVIGKVKKSGLENVLKAKHDDEIYWLQKYLDRVLTFAEQTQLKQMPAKVAAEDENGNAVPLVVYLPQVKREA